MIEGPALRNLAVAIADACRSGLDPDALRAAVLPKLRRAVPIDALWWATVDPATLLFTQAHRDGLPEEIGPYFVENEFLADDANKWTDLARSRDGVRTLVEATVGDLARSARYRDIFRPLGLSDELRVVLRTGGTCWGFMCLHREGPEGFSSAETQFVGRVAPYLAEGIRLGLLVRDVGSDRENAPGLVLLADDGSLIGSNGPADLWLDELRDPASDRLLPIEVYAVAAELRRAADSMAQPPRLRVRTRSGRWVVIHASWLGLQARETVAVIIEPAAAVEIAPLLMAAYGLTPRERTVTGLVCNGFSTREVASRLHLAEHTVQDHLKSVFSRTGVRSRRELVATILRQEYLPRARAGQPIDASGFFAMSDTRALAPLGSARVRPPSSSTRSIT
jgi:DNA-binding CsgD family transcriptional regulator